MDRAPDLLYVGPCLAEVGTVDVPRECGADMYVEIDAPVVTCPACRLEYDVAERRDWLLLEAKDVLAHAEWIGRAVTALGVPVSPSMIRGWKARGRLIVRGVDREDRPLYRVGDVIDVAAQVEAEQERKRGTSGRISA